MKRSGCFHLLHKLFLPLFLLTFCSMPFLSSVSLAAVPTPNNLYVWGADYSDQLSNGTVSNNNIPVQISGLNDIVSIAAADTHVVVLKSDGTVWAWGTNISGELGDGTNINSNLPVQVSGLSGVIAIAASSG
jgi:alpha-tubulin suppressor-like RCC1 family protein